MAKNETNRGQNEDHPGAFLGGGAAGAVAGAAIGSLGGPAGTVVGAAIGGFAGAEAGESMASMPHDEEAYWKENYQSRPYVEPDSNYEDYAPAYRSGYKASCACGDGAKPFEEVEDTIKEDYEKDDNAHLDWNAVRGAAQDAYNRTLQLREERLRAEKDRVQTGEVSVRKDVITENKTLSVPVEREEVVVERRPVSGTAAAGTGPIEKETPEEVARIKVNEERVRLEKDTVPTEEVRVSKQTSKGTQEVSGTVKKEQVRVEKQGDVNVRDKPNNKPKG